MHVSRGSLLLAVALIFARPLPAQQSPYSTLTLRAGVTAARTLAPLHQYYPGNDGVAIEVETPFEFGLLGVVADAVTLRGATPAQVTTSTDVIALDWRRLMPLSHATAIRAGIRVGDFHMRFHDPHFNDPGATPDHGTEEWLVGPVAAFDVNLGRCHVTTQGDWIYLPSATPMRMVHVTLLGGVTVSAPAWLRGFLQ